MTVYDFDGTVYDGDSTVDFWKFCLKRRPSRLLFLAHAIIGGSLYVFGRITMTELKQWFFKFLKSIPDLEKELSCFWDKHEHKIKPWYLIQKKPGDVIISASPEFLLKPVCDKMDVRLIASRVDKCTGIFLGENCFGEEKTRRFKIEYPNVTIDVFYSDSQSDDPLARMASMAYWVSGNRVMPWNECKLSLAARIRLIFFAPDFFLFAVCGGCGTLINFCCSLMVSRYIDPTLAYVCGYALSLFATYILNTYLIFKQPFSFTRFIKFVISYIPNFLILFALVAALLNVCKLSGIFVYSVAAFFGLPVTYILVRAFAFRGKRRKGKQNG